MKQPRKRDVLSLIRKAGGKDAVANLLHCQPRTVEGWMMDYPHRHMPESKKQILKALINGNTRI